MKQWKLPKIKGFILNSSLLAHLYMWKECYICQSRWVIGEMLWKTCWGIHWKFGEHIEDMMVIYWEFKGNIMGAKENWKISSSESTRPPNLKGKNTKHLACVFGPSLWLHEISPPKRVHHHFWPELYASQVQFFVVEFDWLMEKKS